MSVHFGVRWACGLLCGLGIATPAAAQAVLGAHTLLGQEDGHASSPAVTAPVTYWPSGFIKRIR